MKKDEQIQTFFKAYPSLLAFFEDQETVLKDADSYLEANNWQVAAHHAARLGDREEVILKKLVERTQVKIKFFGEAAPSR